MRFLPVSLTTILVELQNLDETLALFAALTANPVEGVVEMVPAARTVMIRFRPDEISAQQLAARIALYDIGNRPDIIGETVEIPVHYDGEDLADVAELTGLSVEEVILRHTQSTFTVAFCGFAPGFGYLVGGDPALHVPRRKSPRTRIPAGSVALAGEFSGVYPQNSPGGWQIIGTTPEKMWDLGRMPPALFQPGYTVRFYDLATTGKSYHPAVTLEASGAEIASEDRMDFLDVLAAPVPALFQDAGRFGQTGQGVSCSGALDQGALAAANRIVGNPANTACLEIAMGGFTFKASCSGVFALTGAPCPIEIQPTQGKALAGTTYQPIAFQKDDVVTIGYAKTGARSYLAIRGGFDVEPVLGSTATDTLAVVGPVPVKAGTRIVLKGSSHLHTAVLLDEQPAFCHPAVGEEIILDVIMGPRTDWFTENGLDTFLNQSWTVTPQSNRVGVRLSGNVALERKDNRELPSEGTATGAIQVPHSGQPVLFLADHPLTGGYPVIATVAEYHLDLAGQLPVNARIRFRPIQPFADISSGEPA